MAAPLREGNEDPRNQREKLSRRFRGWCPLTSKRTGRDQGTFVGKERKKLDFSAAQETGRKIRTTFRCVEKDGLLSRAQRFLIGS